KAARLSCQSRSAAFPGASPSMIERVVMWARIPLRTLGVFPPPTKPRLARVWSVSNLPEAGKPAAGWGRVREGGGSCANASAAIASPQSLSPSPSPSPSLSPSPSPSPPHKGEGRRSRHGLRAVGIGFLVAGIAQATFAQTPPTPAATQQSRVTIGYVEVAGDPR